MGHRIVESMVGSPAPRSTDAGILIGRLRLPVIKNMTIGIELPLILGGHPKAATYDQFKTGHSEGLRHTH